jgi:cytochrome P450
VPPIERQTWLRTSIQGLREFAEALIAQKRKKPADDIVSRLIAIDDDGLRLTNEELISFIFLFLPAGFETTTNLLSNMAVALASRPDVFDQLRTDPALIPNFIDEVLRHDPPVHGSVRITTENTDLAGTVLTAGSWVLALLGSANRDEDKFPGAERFDLGRKTQGGLSFGWGQHFCLGAQLARMEATIALKEWLLRYGWIERTTQRLAYSTSMTVRGPLVLPMRLHPSDGGKS